MSHYGVLIIIGEEEVFYFKMLRFWDNSSVPLIAAISYNIPDK